MTSRVLKGWAVRASLVAMATTGVVAPARGAVNADGQTVSDPFTVLSGQVFNEVLVDDSSVLNVAGGDAFDVDALDTSTVNLSDGRIFELNVSGLSGFSQSGGLIDTLSLSQGATARITAGELLSTLEVSDMASATVSGGVYLDIRGRVSDSGNLDITGGDFDFDVCHGSVVEVSSHGSINVTGGTSLGINSRDNSTVDVAGGERMFVTSFGHSSARISDGIRHNVATLDHSIAMITGGSQLRAHAADDSIAVIAGGLVEELGVNDQDRLYIVGPNLSITSNPFDGNRVTGNLLDGSPINLLIDGSINQIILTEEFPDIIPEPPSRYPSNRAMACPR